MNTRAVSVLLAICFLGAACGPTSHKGKVDGGGNGDGGSNNLPHTLDGIVVTPANPIVQLDLNATGSQVFSVQAEYEDGTSDDVTTQVTWTVANAAVGTMTGPTLSIPAFAASGAVTSTITATLGNLTGMAQITVVAYRQTGAQQDFFFILPYQDTAGPQNKPLDFSTAIPALDVFFLMDTTGSMGGEIANLQNALTGTVIPQIQTAVTNSQFGVGALEDFPISPYGNNPCPIQNTPDQPFQLLQPITNSTSAITTGVAKLSTGAGGSPIGCGNDTPEGGFEAIYQAATGEGLTSPAPTNIPANHTGIGGVGFRAGTMPVIVAISDADWHATGETGNCEGQAEAYAAPVSTVAHTRQNTKDALNTICARLVGIAAVNAAVPATCESESDMTDLATATGARVPPAAWDVGTRPTGCAANQCCTGINGVGKAVDANGLCPVVFEANTDGTGVSTSVVTGIQMLTRFATFDVTSNPQGVATDINGNPLPTPHTTVDFLKMITPVSFTLPPAPPVVPNPTFDATAFHGVTPGTVVSFTVDAFNDFVPQTADPQIFKATIQVLAGGCTPLDQRDVLILVPPNPIIIN